MLSELCRTKKENKINFLALKIMLAFLRSILFVFITCTAIAQDIKLMKSTMGFSAGELSNWAVGNISINHTIGQSSSVNHLQSNQIHLLQGFQYHYSFQCFDCTLSTSSISVYPNPSLGLINIQWNEGEVHCKQRNLNKSEQMLYVK